MFQLDLKMDRREFLATSVRLAALFGLHTSAVGKVAEGLGTVASGGAPVLWLQGQSCSGCSISLLNTYPRSVLRFLTGDIQLKFHQTLSAATGKVAVDAVEKTIAEGGYFLVVEGAVPRGIPEACTFAHEPFLDQLRRAAGPAKAILAVGACAAYGGIPAAEGNPTGAESIPKFLKAEKIDKPWVAIPGCPCHPDWLVGTVVHILQFGLPQMDRDHRPTMFFGKTIHEQCPRFAFWERKQFAKNFGEDGCLFKIGCQGPITHGDCTVRRWNSGVNDCISSGGACTGCASPDYPRTKDFPMYYQVGGKQA